MFILHSLPSASITVPLLAHGAASMGDQARLDIVSLTLLFTYSYIYGEIKYGGEIWIGVRFESGKVPIYYLASCQ